MGKLNSKAGAVKKAASKPASKPKKAAAKEE
jgi:hypothetical protein